MWWSCIDVASSAPVSVCQCCSELFASLSIICVRRIVPCGVLFWSGVKDVHFEWKDEHMWTGSWPCNGMGQDPPADQVLVHCGVVLSSLYV